MASGASGRNRGLLPLPRPRICDSDNSKSYKKLSAQIKLKGNLAQKPCGPSIPRPRGGARLSDGDGRFSGCEFTVRRFRRNWNHAQAVMMIAPIQKSVVGVVDTPGLRALGSKWARLLDNLPDVSELLDASGTLSGETYGIKHRVEIVPFFAGPHGSRAIRWAEPIYILVLANGVLSLTASLPNRKIVLRVERRFKNLVCQYLFQSVPIVGGGRADNVILRDDLIRGDDRDL